MVTDGSKAKAPAISPWRRIASAVCASSRIIGA
jgi:hypothetical protein